MESLFAEVGDRRQPTPSPSQEGRGKQETGEMGMSEEVGAKFCPKIFMPKSCLKYVPF